MSIRIIETGSPLTDRAVAAVRDRLRRGGLADIRTGALSAQKVTTAVREIIADVERRGDKALIELTAKFDRVRLTAGELRVPAARIAAARAEADEPFMGIIRRAIRNIRQYQRSILLKDPPAIRRGGRRLGVRYLSVDRVGVYVPGGRAFYPSTVVMTVVPAIVAGVREIAICCPPTAGDDVHPMVLALAAELGVKEVYRVGGAQAVAAMAVGTRTIRKVDKVVGPGNAFVAEAKRQLFGRVGIDSIAGPSEVLIVADGGARPQWVAADMLAQAEHDPGSAVLVTPSAKLAKDVAAAVDAQIATMERAPAARAAIEQFSAIIVVRDLDTACDVANDFAPEHLQVIVRAAHERRALARIRHAGAIFIGPHTPVPLGDYYAGPSHVLPTGGTARFFSPLSCNDFLKASSIVRYDASSLAADAADVMAFARREGLTGHAAAVEVRMRGKARRM
ncbi:MAG: histidinol dehydrogenase [Phycisphaerae bacterium]